jgi:MFS family permease
MSMNSDVLDDSGDKAPVWTLYSKRQRWTFLSILFLVSTSNYIDRQLVSILLEPIKSEFGVSDTMLGLLTGFSFALFYATLGIPVARFADRGNRRVIIAGSIAVWSFFTAICGFASQFWHLAVARIGVGAGEAGAIPPAHSLLADYFPPEERGRALGIFMISATVGYLIAFVGGSQIAVNFGWRSAFFVMGIPGLLLAVIVFFGLPEPRSLPGRSLGLDDRETIRQSWTALTAKPGFINLTIAMVLYFVVAYGGFIFLPSFMVRVHGQSLEQVGIIFGLISAINAVLGTVIGGYAADKLCKRDARWIAWGPAIAMALCAPIHVAAMIAPTFNGFLILSFIGGIFVSAGPPMLFAHLHVICGSPRRATSVALMFLFANLIGLGLGPVMSGALTDLLTARMGEGGIRWSLVVVMTIFLPAGWFAWRSARTLNTDAEV